MPRACTRRAEPGGPDGIFGAHKFMNVIAMTKQKADFESHYRIAFTKDMGARLAYARDAMGLRQADLAALLGVTQDHIWRLETGKSAVSLFSVGAFRTVMRGRMEFVLFREGSLARDFQTLEERMKINELRMVGKKCRV